MDQARRADPPDGGSGDASRLQLDDYLDDEALEEALRATEFDQANERFDRLGGDEDLLLRLQLHGFAGKEWDRAAEEFAVYGMAVLRSWLRTQLIFIKVRQRTRMPLARPPEDWLDELDVRVSVAEDTIIRAIAKFREVLMDGGWRSDGGASLRTYFIGQCLFQILNVFRDAAKAERQRRKRELVQSPEEVERLRVGSAAPADAALMNRLTTEELLESVHPRARGAMARRARGESYEEIAVAEGFADAKAVENRLGYERRRRDSAKSKEIS